MGSKNNMVNEMVILDNDNDILKALINIINNKQVDGIKNLVRKSINALMSNVNVSSMVNIVINEIQLGINTKREK